MATVTIRVRKWHQPTEDRADDILLPEPGAEISTSFDTVKRVTDVNGEYVETVPADFSQPLIISVKTADGVGRSIETKLIEAGDVLEYSF